jgi:RNA polymerase sigma-70 factor (ECF subfamily)
MAATLPSATTWSDKDLAARFAREAAPLFAVLSRGAMRLTHNAADAEDLLQDTLLHAYAGFGTFQDGSNLQAWLFRILYNRWVSGYRAKQSRPREVSVGAIAEWEHAGRVERQSAQRGSVEAEVVDVLPGNEMKAAIDGLPEVFRAAVYYADVQGYTYAETAVILGIPQGTVMSRVSRARQRMRISLAPHTSQPERGDRAENLWRVGESADRPG